MVYVEVKLKTKMTIMTNDLVDHNSSLFTLHFFTLSIARRGH